MRSCVFFVLKSNMCEITKIFMRFGRYFKMVANSINDDRIKVKKLMCGGYDETACFTYECHCYFSVG